MLSNAEMTVALQTEVMLLANSCHTLAALQHLSKLSLNKDNFETICNCFLQP